MEIGLDFKEFIQLLNKHQIEYLVVGGYAVALYGYPRYTGDIDFWVKPNEVNAKKLVSALIDFGFGSLDVDVNDFNKEDSVVQLGFPPNRIDIITSVSGLSFDECWSKKEIIISENDEVNYISLHHLRINKKTTGRERDLLDLKNLPEE
ncbi:MAG: hypothetical protein WCO28_04805 [Bacteroidota bacterium]